MSNTFARSVMDRVGDRGDRAYAHDFTNTLGTKRIHSVSVDMNGTRPTLSDIAALFRSAEIEPFTKGVEESDARSQIQVLPHAIHLQCERETSFCRPAKGTARA
jgi:hypothetical protein